jgi:hypothetical protein
MKVRIYGWMEVLTTLSNDERCRVNNGMRRMLCSRLGNSKLFKDWLSLEDARNISRKQECQDYT